MVKCCLTSLLIAIVIDAAFGADAPPVGEVTLRESECVEFARKLEATASAGEWDFYAEHLDLEAMLAKAKAGVEITPKDQRSLLAGFKEEFFGLKGLQTMRRDGHGYRFLRYLLVDKCPRLLFRVLSTFA